MDFSLLRSSIHGIFQATVLEWVAISFSRGSSQPRDQTKDDVICTSKVIDISTGNLDSRLCFIQPGISHDVLCIDFEVFALDFFGGSDGKASAHNAGDLCSIPGLGRSSGEGNGNPLQYSCLENPMDGGAW